MWRLEVSLEHLSQPLSSLFYFLNTRSLSENGVHICLDWLTRKLLESSCSCLLDIMPDFYMGSRSQIQVFMLLRQTLYLLNHLPSPLIFMLWVLFLSVFSEWSLYNITIFPNVFLSIYTFIFYIQIFLLHQLILVTIQLYFFSDCLIASK